MPFELRERARNLISETARHRSFERCPARRRYAFPDRASPASSDTRPATAQIQTAPMNGRTLIGSRPFSSAAPPRGLSSGAQQFQRGGSGEVRLVVCAPRVRGLDDSSRLESFRYAVPAAHGL